MKWVKTTRSKLRSSETLTKILTRSKRKQTGLSAWLRGKNSWKKRRRRIWTCSQSSSRREKRKWHLRSSSSRIIQSFLKIVELNREFQSKRLHQLSLRQSSLYKSKLSILKDQQWLTDQLQRAQKVQRSLPRCSRRIPNSSRKSTTPLWLCCSNLETLQTPICRIYMNRCGL